MAERRLARTSAFMTGLGAKPVVDDALLARIRRPVRLMQVRVRLVGDQLRSFLA